MIITSRLMRKVGKKRRHTFSHGSSSSIAAMKSLPKDLLVEVVASVASHSFTDLHNMKLCCKDFLDAAKDNYVFQRVSLDKFPLIQWFPHDKESAFLKRCRESQNLESLYREGLRECLGNGNIDGLESLNMAAQKGHKEAKYVYGIILLCSQDEKLIEQGLEHLRFLRKSKCVVRTRNKVEQMARLMWIDNRMLMPNQKPLCPFENTCKGWRVKKGRWLLLDDEDDDISDDNSCEYCRWDHELKFFYALFNAIN